MTSIINTYAHSFPVDRDGSRRGNGDAIMTPDVNGWMPISTAPRDGTEFLVSLPRQGQVMFLARFNTLYRHFEQKGSPAYFHPGDVWQPLPKPPVSP